MASSASIQACTPSFENNVNVIFDQPYVTDALESSSNTRFLFTLNFDLSSLFILDNEIILGFHVTSSKLKIKELSVLLRF